ncbi:MAG: YceI family protein [Acidobacteria bacterium]|nr:YceI family protein [Acidobacteriota bacterium]
MSSRIILALLLSAGAPAAFGQKAQPQTMRAVAEKSRIEVRLDKAGFFKALGDNHVILAESFSCEVQFEEASPEKSTVHVRVLSNALKASDPQISAEKRAQVQTKMESDAVLDVARSPEIDFVSKRIAPLGSNRYRVEGDLRIRTSAQQVQFEMTLTREGEQFHARGEARFKLTTFGIEPPSGAGGSIKVKDEIRVLLDLILVVKTKPVHSP